LRCLAVARFLIAAKPPADFSSAALLRGTRGSPALGPKELNLFAPLVDESHGGLPRDMSKRRRLKRNVGLPKTSARFHLRRACNGGVAVLLTTPTDEWAFRGSLKEVRGERILLDAKRIRGEGPIIPGMLVLLSFSDHEGTSVGICWVERYAPERTEREGDRFVLTAPSTLATERGRRVYRVPTEEVEGLRASLGAREGKLIPVVVRNLSIAGMSVRVGESTDHGLRVDQETSVAIALEGESLVLDALVRRVGQRRIAFAFHRIESPDQAPELLRRIVNRVEGTFLRARVRAKEEDGE